VNPQQYVRLSGDDVIVTCPTCGYTETHPGPEDIGFLLDRCDQNWNYRKPWYYCINHGDPAFLPHQVS
jgi:hypothetical protein